MGKQTIKELEAQVKQLAMQLELSVAAERAWETTMMRVCGEDGVGSVADKFKQLTEANQQLRDENLKSTSGLYDVVAENVALKSVIEAVRDVAAHSDGISGWHLNGDVAQWEEILPEIDDVETPATDAQIAALRAEGVNMAIQHLHSKFEGTGNIGVPVMALEWLAAQLRSQSAASPEVDDASDIEPFGFVRRSGDQVVIDVNGDPHIKDGMPVYTRQSEQVKGVQS